MKKSGTISLEPEDWQWIDNQVKSGEYDSRSAVIRKLVRDAMKKKVFEVPLI